MEKIDYNGIQLLRWKSGPSSFFADPEKGARLIGWNIRMSDGTYRDVIYWPVNVGSTPFSKIRGGNPILFPFAGRSFHKGQVGYWRDGQGTVRPMPRNGFARNSHFELTSATERGFIAELRPEAAAIEAYPFDYTFKVCYEFTDIAFTVYLTLENHGEQVLLWSAGHHFYFTLPWHEGLTRKDYRYQVPAKKCFTHAPDGSLQNVIKGWEKDLSFGNLENSDRIYTRLTGDTFRFGPNGGEEDIGIRFLNDESTLSAWNSFLVWTESPESAFYCIEPWMGPPNSSEHGKGLHAVNAGSSATFGVEVSLI
ncbi:MAG: aldose epimerase [Verrucomicrobiota bacterium]|nr:aldose epimerase [Verrucomicrobiota bacterium]